MIGWARLCVFACVLACVLDLEAMRGVFGFIIIDVVMRFVCCSNSLGWLDS